MKMYLSFKVMEVSRKISPVKKKCWIKQKTHQKTDSKEVKLLPQLRNISKAKYIVHLDLKETRMYCRLKPMLRLFVISSKVQITLVNSKHKVYISYSYWGCLCSRLLNSIRQLVFLHGAISHVRRVWCSWLFRDGVVQMAHFMLRKERNQLQHLLIYIERYI